MAAFGLGCIVFFAVSSLGLLVGAVLLRGAVAVANRFLGPPAPPDSFGQWDDWDSDEPAPVARAGPARAVPEPGLATGMLITFVLAGVAAVGYVALAVIVEGVLGFNELDGGLEFVLLFLLGLPFTGFTLSLLLTALLPTTFTRAVLIAFLYHLLGVVGAGVVAAALMGALFVLMG